MLPSIIDKDLMLKANCIVDNGDNIDWVFDSVHSYHIYRDKSYFTRVMACEHERVTLLSGEEVVIEAIKEVHLRMQNGFLRKLRNARYIPMMLRSNFIESIRED